MAAGFPWFVIFSESARNRDVKLGPATFGSTSLLAFTTGAPHLANFFTHQFMRYAPAPADENKKRWQVAVKVLACRLPLLGYSVGVV
jgi:hypothetical protein